MSNEGLKLCPWCGSPAEVHEFTPYGKSTMIGSAPWARCGQHSKFDCCPGAIVLVSIPIWNTRDASRNGDKAMTDQAPELKPLLDLFRKMQGAAQNYLEPRTYMRRSPGGTCKYDNEVRMPSPYHAENQVFLEEKRRAEFFIRDILYFLDGPEQREAEKAAEAWNTRADLAVKVKPLVWREHNNGHEYADLLGLEYEVGYENGSFFWYEARNDVFGEGFAEEEHAKAAAQIDANERILSALEGGAS